MTITKIIAAATVSCALFAGSAFAQSSATDAEDYAKDKITTEAKDVAKDAVKDTAKDVMTSDDAMMPKGDPLIITTGEGEIGVSKDGMMMKGEEIATHSKMDAPKMMDKPKIMDAPVAEPTLVVIGCPEGTTAQDDGTCMITGDYEEQPKS